jgi:hypothetical protein
VGSEPIGIAVAALVAAVTIVCLAVPASAVFTDTAAPYVSRQWATAPSDASGAPVAVGPVAVRSDGSLIAGPVDGPLHLLPAAGGKLDSSNIFGPRDLQANAIVIRRGQLYVLTRSPNDTCPIDVLDVNSGRPLKTITWRQCQWPVVGIDPVNSDLILQDFVKSKCSPCALDGHGIVDFDPDTGTTTTLVSSPFSAYSEAIATSPDGQWIFVAEEPAGSTNGQNKSIYIDAYPRVAGGNAQAYRILVPSQTSPDGMAYAGEAGCFADSLVYADDFGTVYAVPHPSPISTTSNVIATSKQPDGPTYSNQSEMTLDTKGNMVVDSFSEVMTVECPVAGSPPPPPKPPPAPPPRPQPPKPPAPAAAKPAPPAQTPALVHAAATQSAPVTPAGPGLGTTSAPAASQAIAPNGAMVDVPQDQPVMHMAATRLPANAPPWLFLALGMAATTLMAGGAWVVVREPTPNIRTVRIDP